MDSPKACGPPPSEATYADLTTAAASISEIHPFQTQFQTTTSYIRV
jgi:hypothetical protein